MRVCSSSRSGMTSYEPPSNMQAPLPVDGEWNYHRGTMHSSLNLSPTSFCTSTTLLAKADRPSGKQLIAQHGRDCLVMVCGSLTPNLNSPRDGRLHLVDILAVKHIVIAKASEMPRGRSWLTFTVTRKEDNIIKANPNMESPRKSSLYNLVEDHSRSSLDDETSSSPVSTFS